MSGKIADHNTRTIITISKELKKDVEHIAKEQNRSFSNLVVTLLQKFVDDYHKDNKDKK